jgi:hypothetical protein
MDKWVELSVINFAADTPNIDIDDVGCGIEVEIPNVLQQHSPRNHPSLIANQILKQLEFARKQADIPAASAGGSRYQIQLEIPDTQHRFLDNRVAAPSESLNARQQLNERERFGKVVVSACAQSADAIVNLTKSTNNQNRGNDASLAQAAHDFNSVDVRQHAIYRYHCKSRRKPKIHCIAAVSGYVHLIAVHGQRLDELARCLVIVFNDENVPVPCRHGLKFPDQ